MAADSVKALDPGMHLDFLPEELYIFLTFKEPSSQRPVCLISYEEDGTFRAPQVMFQMVPDAACITHTRS